MSESKVGVTISEDLVAPIIEAKVQAAIIESLGEEEGVIERLVSEALTKKIEPDRYSSKKIPWIDHVCQKVVRAAAEQAIQKWAASQQDKIAAEFVRQLKTAKTSKAVVKSMIDGMSVAAGSKWKFSVNLGED